MIAANELRIGNLVGRQLKQWPDNIFTVVEVAEMNSKFSNGENYYWSCEDMDGIPITPEWLERAWFEKQPNGIWYLLDGIGVMFSGVVQIGDDVNTQKFKKCEYVHQLQNLFFALTGKELTFK